MARRNFLKIILLAASTPAIVKADSLVKIHLSGGATLDGGHTEDKPNGSYTPSKCKSISHGAGN